MTVQSQTVTPARFRAGMTITKIVPFGQPLPGHNIKVTIVEDANNKIKILPEALTNQIAAGEVVDRPASVVKELVENAIDAEADEITVVIKDGGKALIQVIDNGIGMSQSDLLLAFQRHATSKIFYYEDLSNITTLGFRGEALASIASVARVDAKSVQREEDHGHAIAVEGGVMSEVQAAAGNHGTSIAVKHLFYNTPARRKFLKAASTEYRQILNVMNRFYLAFPDIAFTFVNGDEVLTELHQESLPERIRNVLGERIQRNLLAIENEGPVRIHGYIGNQEAMRRSRGDQYLFFNRRYFVNKSLNYAITSAYGEILPRGSYPIYLVFLEMDAEQVDVNVHPTKMEVKFANDALVFSSVRGSVKRALTSSDVVPRVSHGNEFDPSMLSRETSTLDMDFGRAPSHDVHTPFRERPPETSISPPTSESEGAQPTSYGKPVFERTNIWQVHNKYIISQIKNGLIVIDQHVAHERILYEKALRDFEHRRPSSQQLLFPQIIEFSSEDYALLHEMLPFLESIGFVIKAFGKNTVALEGVPSGIKISNDEKVLLDILDEYKRGKRDSTEIRENVAASFACHTAIRAGESLTLDEMNMLIDMLFSTKEPYFCPHGRPVIINIPLEELDRRFKRH